MNNINKIRVTNCIIDELHIRQQTNGINLSSSRDNWQIDSYLLAKFQNDLEAGNVNNEGVQIVKFVIKRRKLNELTSLTLDYVDFASEHAVEYTDYTQGNGEYIYSIVPVGENGLEGSPNSVEIESVFVGWYLVDKDTGSILSFDKSLDSQPYIETTLNRGRVQVQTFSKYPTVFYTEEQYHSFSLSTVIIPSEFSRVGKNYEELVNNFINQSKPFLVKSSDGRLFVCDVANPRFSAPMNTWKTFDHATLTLDFVEVDSYENYMSDGN